MRPVSKRCGCWRAGLLAGALGVGLVVTASIDTSAQQSRQDGPQDGQRSGPGQPGRTPANPQAKQAPPPKPVPKFLRRPGSTSVPERASERAALLAELYAYLATATDEDVAKRTAAAIEHVWLVSGSDTVNLLMQRAARAVAEKKPQLAVKLLDQAISLAPDYPELFNRRAVVHFANSDLDHAIGDLRRTLALDPNHFKALEGLAQIFKEIGRKKAALQVFRRLHEVHPYMPGAKTAIEELEREIEGHRS